MVIFKMETWQNKAGREGTTSFPGSTPLSRWRLEDRNRGLMIEKRCSFLVTSLCATVHMKNQIWRPLPKAKSSRAYLLMNTWYGRRTKKIEPGSVIWTRARITKLEYLFFTEFQFQPSVAVSLRARLARLPRPQAPLRAGKQGAWGVMVRRRSASSRMQQSHNPTRTALKQGATPAGDFSSSSKGRARNWLHSKPFA